LIGQRNKKERQTLIIGFGSEILTDDGIALKIVKDLKLNLDNNLFDFREVNLISLETLNLLIDYKNIVFIDAVKNKTESLGEVNYYRLNNFNNSLHLFNSHDLTLQQLIELGRIFSAELTEDIQVVTININEFEEFGYELSNSMKSVYPNIYEQIFNLVKYCENILELKE